MSDVDRAFAFVVAGKQLPAAFSIGYEISSVHVEDLLIPPELRDRVDERLCAAAKLYA